MTIDEFRNVDLRIVKVLAAERVSGSDKLLKLMVSLGNEERQIIAGIGKSYEPEVLVGKELVIVANLEPRTVMGLESQGMLLAAGDSPETVTLIGPEHEVPPGLLLR